MKSDGVNYFYMLWNYIDVITPMTIMTLLFINAFSIDINPEMERGI
jgi:hypothetical protein